MPSASTETMKSSIHQLFLTPYSFRSRNPGTATPGSCGVRVVQPNCFSDVQDLGAIDIQRGRDHGMPPYNQLRIAYRLRTEVLVHSHHRRVHRKWFPRSRLIRSPRSDRRSEHPGLHQAQSRRWQGHPSEENDEAREDVVLETRRTTLAARLRAIIGARGTVNKVDAFVGMLCEPHELRRNGSSGSYSSRCGRGSRLVLHARSVIRSAP